MFQPVESNVNFPKLEEQILRFLARSKDLRKIARAASGRRGTAVRVLRRTANRQWHAAPRALLDPGRSKIYFRATAPCAVTCASGRRAGIRTACRSKWKSAKSWASTRKKTSKNYGIEPFIQKCQQSVWRYMQEWAADDRADWLLGQIWTRPTSTYHQSYVESVWWSLKQLVSIAGCYTRATKSSGGWAQGGTALSAGEVGQGYREVADPSVYVKVPAGKRRADEETWTGRRQFAGVDHHTLGRCPATSLRRRASRFGVFSRPR